MTVHKNLTDWLSYLEQLHPSEIELGLTRISKVGNQLDLINFDATVITVAGTNGKGTTCAFLENILLKAGFKVGVYSSPHIQRYTERLRINQKELTESEHCRAFTMVESARVETSLSYFEYVTLGCLQLLKEQQCDYILLEVGLGGRLDATNMVEPDISVVTTVAIDHIDWLGDDREKIGFEKAGIFRANKPAVCGDLNPPQSLINYANELGSNITYANTDFTFEDRGGAWDWIGKHKIENIAPTSMPMQNAATALAVIEALKLDIEDSLLRQAIQEASLPGRFQKIDHINAVYLDVAHNPQSAQYLATRIESLKKNSEGAEQGKVIAIVGMLQDKDIIGTFDVINEQIDQYNFISLDCYRGASHETLLEYYKQSQNANKVVNCFENIELAYKSVIKNEISSDIIIIFGSFYTVSNFLNFSQG